MLKIFQWLNKVVDIFFPKFCIWCKKEGEFLCNDCFKQIKKNQNPIDEWLYIPCPYHKNEILKRALHLMKYKFYKELSKDMAELLIEVFKNNPLPKDTVIVPIPLHKKREKFRGFNQAKLIANYISENLNLPVLDLLIRDKETKSQATLSKEERIKNVKGVFEINPKININKNTPILVLDDVCTTLSTMQSAVLTLQKNGFRAIMGSAIARAEIDKH